MNSFAVNLARCTHHVSSSSSSSTASARRACSSSFVTRRHKATAVGTTTTSAAAARISTDGTSATTTSPSSSSTVRATCFSTSQSGSGSGSRRFVAVRAAGGAAAGANAIKGADGGGSVDDPWNKGPLDMDNRLYGYLLANTREPEVLRRLRVETSQLRGSQMQIPPEQGAFLALVVELMGAKNIIEVGTYTGYSSIAMALALPSDGKLVACDVSEPSFEVARKYWAEAGVEHLIEERLGDAKAALDDVIAAGGADSFDIGGGEQDSRGTPNPHTTRATPPHSRRLHSPVRFVSLTPPVKNINTFCVPVHYVNVV